MAEKPLFKAAVHIQGSFIKGSLPVIHNKFPGLWAAAFIDACEDKIVLRWAEGILSEKSKEIPLSRIKEFSVIKVNRFPLAFLSDEHIYSVTFGEGNKTYGMKLAPVRNSMYHPHLVKYFRKNIPKKEIKPN